MSETPVSNPDAFGADVVLADVKAHTLSEALEAVLQALYKERSLRQEDVPVAREALLSREAAGATAVGNAVAIPHARLEIVRRMVLAVARIDSPGLPPGPDGQPVRLVFCFLSPKDGRWDAHLTLLQRISRSARDPGWVQACLTAPGAVGFAHMLRTGAGRNRHEEDSAKPTP